jgi:hypothetical protein
MHMSGKTWNADREPDLLLGRPRSDHLAIWVIRREYPEATDYWDANWLQTRIELFAGGVHAKIGANLRAEEFRRFREALERVDARASREALMEPLEPWLKVRVTTSSTGALAVEGEVSDEVGIGNQVVFALRSDLGLADQTQMIRSLRTIEERFPVLGTP